MLASLLVNLASALSTIFRIGVLVIVYNITLRFSFISTMVRKSKKSDLGRAIMRKQQHNAEKRKTWNTPAAEMAAAVGRHSVAGEERRLVSILEANDVDELMANALLANQSFAAERHAEPLAPQSVVVVTPTPHDSEARREVDKTELRIPRRPPWKSDTSFEQLMRNEMEAFLTWRRHIASIEDRLSLADTGARVTTLTPFEKNIEVWRQLWRVVERSDIVLQIVDARNPALFLCSDLVRYVETEMHRAHLVVMNKADLLSSAMLDRWDEYFRNQNLDVIFFSAFKASVGEKPHDSRVLDPIQLIQRLEQVVPTNPVPRPDGRVVVGLCGYPNVGKSSSINVLLDSTIQSPENDKKLVNSSSVNEGLVLQDGNHNDEGNDLTKSDGKSEISHDVYETDNEVRVAKRVAVSATPGKTKHFQTLILTDRVILCDCPGLVFPNFSSSKAELICAGVLSIDHMRGDYEAPIALIASRVPASILAAVYGIQFPDGAAIATHDTRPGHYVSASILLDTHASARGFMTDHGRPDRSRSARVLLKDFTSGRIVYAHAPTGHGEANIGAAVFARKGRLVYERVAAAEAAETNHVTGNDIANFGIDNEENASVPVRALINDKRKHDKRQDKREPQEFVRVQRAYDSIV